MYGIFTAICAFVRPGDEVILFEPTYDSYAPAVELNGGKPVFVRLQYPDYGIVWQDVQRAISDKTRMIVINTPNNPTTSVFSAEDMRVLADMCATPASSSSLTKFMSTSYMMVISIKAWHASPDSPSAASSCRHSARLTASPAGRWAMCSHRELMSEFRKVHQFNVFVTNSPLQHVLAEFMGDKDAYLSLPAFYQRKRDFFVTRLEGSRFRVLPSRGTFFQNLAYDRITDEKDSDLAIRLTKEKGLASIPLSAFYHDGHCDNVLRFCFAKSEETLAKGAAILRTL